MDNTGNKLTTSILKEFGFEYEVFKDGDGDEVKWWIKDGISIYEDSWWIKDGKSTYPKGEEPEIIFSFATYVKADGGFKGGFNIATDQQVKNLYFALKNTELRTKKVENLKQAIIDELLESNISSWEDDGERRNYDDLTKEGAGEIAESIIQRLKTIENE